MLLRCSAHNHVDSHDMFLTRPKTIPSSFDCSLDGACLAQDSFSEAFLNESAAAKEDKSKKALARALSKLVVAEHSDVETNVVFFRHVKQIFNT